MDEKRPARFGPHLDAAPYVISRYELDGEFVHGAMWDLSFTLDKTIEHLQMDGFKPGCNWLYRLDTSYEGIWADWLWFSKERYKCPLDRRHRTGRRTVPYVDLLGGPRVAGLLPATWTHLGVTRDLCDRMLAAGFTGFVPHRLRVKVNQSRLADPPAFVWLDLVSQWCMRKMSVYPPPGNACQFCGWTPVVCPGCGHLERICGGCGEKIVAQDINPRGEVHQGPGDRRFVAMYKSPKTPFIVNAAEWDGSDFMPAYYGPVAIVTGRVVDFLFAENAAPFVAKPVWVDVRGASPEIRDRLESVRTLRQGA